MKRLPKASLAAFAACALVLGACGDDDDTNDDTDTTEEVTDDTTSDDTEDTTSEDTTGDDTEDTTSEDTGTDDTSMDTEDGGDDASAGSFDIRQTAIDMYKDFGLDDEQAECLVDAMDIENLDSAADIDQSAVMGFLDECGINPGDFNMGG